MLNNTHIANDHDGQVSIEIAHIASALSVMILGLALLLITAFAPIQAVHNATHDTRHAFVVPCH